MHDDIAGAHAGTGDAGEANAILGVALNDPDNPDVRDHLRAQTQKQFALARSLDG